MNVRKFVAIGILVLGAGVVPAVAKAPTPRPTVDDIRRELLQLPYYGVFDFLSFKYENGTVTLMGYAYRPTLKSDAERAVRRVAGVESVKDQIEVLPVSMNDDDIRWQAYYAIYRDPSLSRYAPGGGLLWGHRHLTLAGWHVPAVLALGQQSSAWHLVQHASFLVTGLLFWWPVVQPWPSARSEPQWSMVPYLFLATLPCDVLSAFLVFSARVAYPIYLATSGRSEASVLDDQQCAGALMWTSVTIIYLAAAAMLSVRWLAVQRVVAGRVKGTQTLAI